MPNQIKTADDAAKYKEASKAMRKRFRETAASVRVMANEVAKLKDAFAATESAIEAFRNSCPRRADKSCYFHDACDMSCLHGREFQSKLLGLNA